MSNEGTPAGWYHAPGDPEGTQRYWDGSQWVGEAQAAAAPAPQTSVPPPPPGAPAGQVPAGQAAPTAPGAPPPGYVAYQPPSSVGTYASWGTRAIAWLIDYVVVLLVVIVGFAIGGAADSPAIIILAYLAAIAFSIWNVCYKQGTTGQSIGKANRNIKLVRDETAQPVGFGMAFVRYLVAGVIGSICGIYFLLDYLWPLWDQDNKRLTDKIVRMSVVEA